VFQFEGNRPATLVSYEVWQISAEKKVHLQVAHTSVTKMGCGFICGKTNRVDD
jgi:hypothetical protein